MLAVLGWEQFFTDFHRIFFANGTWTFSLQDTLIRLFPGQFWVDAGIVIGALVLLASLLTLILTWPTRKRRGLPKRAAAAAGAPAEDQADPTAAGPAVSGAAAEGKRPRFGRRAKARNSGVDADPADGPEDFLPGSEAHPQTGQGPAVAER